MIDTVIINRAIIVFILFFVLMLPIVALAQTSGTSVGVGAGATAVDPSKNVLDALLAAVTRLNDLMTANNKRVDDIRDIDVKSNAIIRAADDRLNSNLREAETRRVDQLQTQKQAFDLELARINKSSLDSSAILLATAVKELKTDSAERTGKLEQFANEQRGRASGGNEAWALVGLLVTLLLVAGGFILNLVKRNNPNESRHDREDAERYRQFVDKKVSNIPMG